VARAGLAGAAGICLEVQVEGDDDPNRLCGLREGESGQWQFDVAGGRFMAGTIDDEGATTANLILADGSEISGSVVGAAEVTSLRFFVLVVPRGAALDRLVMLDADGAVIDTISVGDEFPVKEQPPAGAFQPLRAGQARLAGSG
jgi:hypothetical protein